MIDFPKREFKSDRKAIFVTGPLTSSGTIADNLDVAMQETWWLVCHGFAPYCPHLYYFVDSGLLLPHADWMEVTLAILKRCDGMRVLPGASKGAEEEQAFAHENNIPIFITRQELQLQNW